MNKKIQITAGIVLLGFVLGAYEFYDLWTIGYPELKQKEDAKQHQVVILEEKARKLQSFAQNIQVIKQEFRELNLQLEVALEHMPRTFNFASLLRKLTMLAQNSGVEISSFRPKKDSVQKKQEPSDKTFYETIFVEFGMSGSFTQTMVFFDQLSRLKRIVNVESLKIETRQDKSVKYAVIPTTANVLIKTYRFSE